MSGTRAWDHVQQFQRALKNALAQLKLWSKNKFKGMKKKQEKLIQCLHNAKQGSSKLVDGEEIRRIESQINSMLIDKEIY